MTSAELIAALALNDPDGSIDVFTADRGVNPFDWEPDSPAAQFSAAHVTVVTDEDGAKSLLISK